MSLSTHHSHIHARAHCLQYVYLNTTSIVNRASGSRTFGSSAVPSAHVTTSKVQQSLGMLNWHGITAVFSYMHRWAMCPPSICTCPRHVSLQEASSMNLDIPGPAAPGQHHAGTSDLAAHASTTQPCNADGPRLGATCTPHQLEQPGS